MTTADEDTPARLGFRFHLGSLFVWTAIFATWLYLGSLLNRPQWGAVGIGFVASFGIGIVGRFAYLHGWRRRFTPPIVIHGFIVALFLLPLLDRLRHSPLEVAKSASRVIVGPIALVSLNSGTRMWATWTVVFTVPVVLSIWAFCLRPSFVSAQLFSAAAFQWYSCGAVYDALGP